MNNLTQSKAFHTQLDLQLLFPPKASGPVKQTKQITIQERELSYTFFSHFHPYVGPLVRRLLQKSISGLQAADTEVAPNSASLPGSVRISLDGATVVTFAGGAQVQLSADVQAVSGGLAVLLGAGMQLRLSAALPATLPAGSQVTLLNGMAPTPPEGTQFAMAPRLTGFLSEDAGLVAAPAFQVLLANGTPATLPANSAVLALRGAQISLPGGAAVTLERSLSRPVLYDDVFAAAGYNPTGLVQRPFPVKDLDFTPSGAYSAYNWELFFHVPLTIAIQLSKNQRFAEAMRWFHYIFDPTDDSDGPTPERFWKVRPFQSTDVKKIEEILVNLSTDADPALRAETTHSIEAWKDAPFRPHVVARYRQEAYMYKTVMAYLDNLLAWGDALFLQDSGESIDEALMLYGMAANLLGPRPLPVPQKGTIRPQTYANLRQDLREFGSALVALETDPLFDLSPFPSAESPAGNERLATLRGMGKALYFCVPRNDKLLSYWDTVADRLFKIHNSLNIQGIFRQLPLFQPPIDPAMLARAVASGLDVGAVINGLNQPLPLVRFQLLLQKATEVTQEVKSLGGALLSAMEKKDNEALAVLRAKHERLILSMVEQVKYVQQEEARKSRESLLQSLALAAQRFTYFERQLGKKPKEINIPVLDDLDADSLKAMKLTLKEPEMPLMDVAVDIAQNLGESGGKIVSSHEAEELGKSGLARDIQDVIKNLNMAAQGTSLIPDFGIKFHFWGLGGDTTLGGTKISDVSKYAADVALAFADRMNYEAGRAAKIGGYARREQDWAYQRNLAAGEITQIFKQLRAAQLREANASQELINHRQSIVNAEQIEHFLNQEGTERTGKKTNQALYTWMNAEVKRLYNQCFQFAFDLAKKAERALQHELGDFKLSYLDYGYLAGKEGLLAGEKLYLDLKRMEMAYHDLNQREYELTKHVSLVQVDPLALLQLRRTGSCTVTLPEALFDMDGPGHYFRRIKTVAVSIPCVVGPYASVNCTLSLLKSSIRKTPITGESYARAGAEDSRFSDYFGSLQSIVTSSAQNDSGLFETNLHDERYLPFEGSGVISEWRLELPANPSQADPAQFDYNTISDVILHIRYTARAGGGLLRKGTIDNLKTQIDTAQAAGSVRLFSARHEFPQAWAVFQGQTLAAGQRAALLLDLQPQHYPFWSQGRLKTVQRVLLLARGAQPVMEVFDRVVIGDAAEKKDSLAKDSSLGNLLAGELQNLKLDKPDGELKLFFNPADRALDDVWIAVTWGGA